MGDLGTNTIDSKINSLWWIENIQFCELKIPLEWLKAIQITARTNESQEIINQKLINHLKSHNWWLQDYWKEKGQPVEQLTIQTWYWNLELYNFSESLTQKHLSQLQNIIKIFAQMKEKSPLFNVKYILIDNIDKPNPYDNSSINGYFLRKENAVELYPNWITFDPHRVKWVLNFPGTVIHELSHGFSAEVQNNWKNTLGWYLLDKSISAPSWLSLHYWNNETSRCVSDYAKYSPDEDLCESMVAAILNPDILDFERLEFIKDNILGVSISQPEITIKRRQSNEIEIPKIKSPVYFIREAPLIFKIL